MTDRIVNEGGEVREVSGPKAIGLFAARSLALSIKMYLDSDGRMQASRQHTPSRMREAATRYTGKTYPRSRAGLVQAKADLVSFLASPESFEGIEVVDRAS